MYMCEYIYVYKEVLSVSTRKGTTICKFAQNWFIYKSIYDITYWIGMITVSKCTVRGSMDPHTE